MAQVADYLVCGFLLKAVAFLAAFLFLIYKLLCHEIFTIPILKSFTTNHIFVAFQFYRFFSYGTSGEFFALT